MLLGISDLCFGIIGSTRFDLHNESEIQIGLYSSQFLELWSWNQWNWFCRIGFGVGWSWFGSVCKNWILRFWKVKTNRILSPIHSWIVFAKQPRFAENDIVVTNWHDQQRSICLGNLEFRDRLETELEITWDLPISKMDLKRFNWSGFESRTRNETGMKWNCQKNHLQSAQEAVCFWSTRAE